MKKPSIPNQKKSFSKLKSILEPLTDQQTNLQYEKANKENQQLKSFQVSQKEIEIERMMPLVKALTHKAAVLGDCETEVLNIGITLADSEAQRDNLQIQIKETSQKIIVDTNNHQIYQKSLITQNDQLQVLLEDQKQFQFKRDQEHEVDLQKLRVEMGNLRIAKDKELAQERAYIEMLCTEKDTRYKELQDQSELYRVTSQQTIDSQNIEIKNLEHNVLAFGGPITSLQNEIDRLQDIESQLKQANINIAKSAEQKTVLKNEVLQASDYILELEEKVYSSNKTSLELLKQLKDAEVEIKSLKTHYIAAKEDEVDKQLAEYLNNYPERSKLKIMFMRESYGKYLFGTKKVSMKIEYDSIQVRVGGGYLSINDFLDKYTPMEFEKLQKKDPLKGFKENAATQKNTGVNISPRKSSPIRAAV